MKMKFLLLTYSLIISGQLLAQNLHFLKYQVGETGYYSYFPGDPGKFDIQKSEDGLLLYVGEIEIQACKYGLVLVLLEDKFFDAGKEQLLDLLISYMDHLKSSFEITGSAGYGKGHTQELNPEVQGVIDFWEDAIGIQFAVKGWIDNKALGFLYISAKKLPNINYQNLFLNGFRFKK
jgi:hypothetical protein